MGVFRQLFLRWKSIQFPWRKDVFKGTDLDGNLYFEQAIRGSLRVRRHVVYKENLNIGEFNQNIIPVQWQSWMRHTRNEPPTIADLLQDVERRKRIQHNVQMLKEKEKAAAIENASSHTAKGSKKFQKISPGDDYQPEEWTPTSTGPSAQRERKRGGGN